MRLRSRNCSFTEPIVDQGTTIISGIALGGMTLNEVASNPQNPGYEPAEPPGYDDATQYDHVTIHQHDEIIHSHDITHVDDISNDAVGSDFQQGLHEKNKTSVRPPHQDLAVEEIVGQFSTTDLFCL